LVFFWYKFAITPLSDFLYKIWLGEEVPGFHPCQISPLWLLKMLAYTAPKIAKNGNFGINLPLRENSGGPQKKLNIGAQLQTFLCAMTP